MTLERARPLAQLVHEKTGGNPFFAIQFLTELAEEGLLAFDPVAQAWRWDTRSHPRQGLHRQCGGSHGGEAEAIVRTHPGRLETIRLSGQCRGNRHLDSGSRGNRRGDARDAPGGRTCRARSSSRMRAYRFLHDRIQQAAYSLIPDEHRADVHLRIGRVLLASMTADQLAEHLFDVGEPTQSGRCAA